MSITQQYTAIAGDVITAARWNNEFGNIYNNLVPLLNNYDSLNLKDNYSAVGDGATSDQSAVATAVAAAISSGKDLYWPAGTYLTTATITGFHTVVHRGPGILKRGSTLFYVDPSTHPGVTNNLYMATTGADTNDGLSAAEPTLTLQYTGNLIYKYNYGDVNWKINIAAGTYQANVSFLRAFPSPNRVQFVGPVVSRGVQPTAVLQASGYGLGTSVIALYLQNYIRAQVTNIRFINARDDASPNANNDSAGLVVDVHSEVYTDNVWSDDCDNGIYITNGSECRVQAGRHGYNNIDGTGVKFIRHCHGTVGYGGSAADITGATGTAFIGGSYGVLIEEFSMAHTDNCYYSAQTLAGVRVNTGRCHVVTSTFNTCAVGIDVRLNGNLGNTSNTFTGCTTNLMLLSGARNAGVLFAESLNLGPAVSDTDGLGGSTQSVTPVTIYTKAFAANEFQLRGTGFKLLLYCKTTGVAGTKTVVVTLGATTLLTATIAAATTSYEIQVDFMITTNTNNERCFTRVLQNGVLAVLAGTTPTEDLSAAKTLTVTHQVTNAADTNTVLFTELQIRH